MKKNEKLFKGKHTRETDGFGELKSKRITYNIRLKRKNKTESEKN